MIFIAVHVELLSDSSFTSVDWDEQSGSLFYSHFQRCPRRNHQPGATRFCCFGAELGKSAMQALGIDRLGF
jgi:hypothetical protein